MLDNLKQKIYIAGHRGMVGSAIMRELKRRGYCNLIHRTRQELDLTNQAAVQQFFEQEKPDQVYLAAATVGGIYANNIYPAKFIYENLMLQTNLIHQAYCNGIKKLLFLGSSCIYPKLADQPISENALLDGKLEPTNEPYAIAKIAGLKMCEAYNRQYGITNEIDYRSIMPTNLYGPGDNYHSKNSHVIPALIRRIDEAKTKNLKEVVIWGTGSPLREFLYVDDLARGAILVMEHPKEAFYKATNNQHCHINIGSGIEIAIGDLAKLITDIVGYKGAIRFNKEMPDGTKRKILCSGIIRKIGFTPQVNLIEGLKLTYEEYKHTNKRKVD